MSKTYHVVRADFDDPAGSMTYDAIFGDHRTVFSDPGAADVEASLLTDESANLDWGKMSPPRYYVDEVPEDGLHEAESEQLAM